jgi:hypothetical protein
LTPPTWLLRGLAKRWLWLQLGACAALLVLCSIDVGLASAHVSCAVYRRIDLDKTLFYCSFQGTPVGGCEFGLCVH